MKHVACDNVWPDTGALLQLMKQAGCVYLQYAVIGKLNLLAYIGRQQMLSQAIPAHDHLRRITLSVSVQ